MTKGFFYRVAVIDWYSRRVLSWRLSNTIDTSFFNDALEEPIERNGAPKIFNTDQGTQLASEKFTGVLLASGIAISMDGKGRWADNIIVERFWRRVKCEEVYLHVYDDIETARESLKRYFKFYNTERKR